MFTLQSIQALRAGRTLPPFHGEPIDDVGRQTSTASSGG